MGNDGGSIPTRRELVKEGARDLTTTQVKEIQTEQQEHYWSTCALSHEPLVQPVVSDALGTLYNKDAVLNHLITSAKEPTDKQALVEKGEAFKDRLRSLRDIVEVRFQSDPEDITKTKVAKWVCPITNKVLGPGTKSIYLVPCGHAFADSVVKEMSGDLCLLCNESYTAENIISILPTSQSEKDRLESRIQSLKDKNLTHSLKKGPGGSKKRKHAGPVPVAENKDGPGMVNTLSEGEPKFSEVSGSIKNQDTASLTAKVLAEQEERTKRRNLGANDNVKSLFSTKDGRDGKNTDFMTRGFSIPANAKR